MTSGNKAAGRRTLAEGAADLTAAGVGVVLSTLAPAGALATPFLKAGFDEAIPADCGV